MFSQLALGSQRLDWDIMPWLPFAYIARPHFSPPTRTGCEGNLVHTH